MGQGGSKIETTTPAPRKPLAGGLMTQLGCAIKNPAISHYLDAQPTTSILANLAKLAADTTELCEVVRLLYAHLTGAGQKVQPRGDWSFLPTEKDVVLQLAQTCLRALDLDFLVRTAALSRPVITTRAEDELDMPSSTIMSDNQLFLISKISASASAAVSRGTPTLLFSLATQGGSWGRFVDNLDGYKGAVLVLIQIREHPNRILGAYLPDGLEESGSKFRGSPESFLFGMSTTAPGGSNPLSVRRTGKFESNYYMLNRSAQYMPKGLGFGGDDKQPRILVASDLQQVSILLACRTYESGGFFDSDSEDYLSHYTLDNLEVWGFGSQVDLDRQQAIRSAREDMKSERRKVNVAKMMGNDPTGLMKKQMNAGERRGEVEVILEERERERERSSQSVKH